MAYDAHQILSFNELVRDVSDIFTKVHFDKFGAQKGLAKIFFSTENTRITLL
jgi:hypothetical protein